MAERHYGKSMAWALSQIRGFHEMGRKSLKEFPGHFSGGKGKAQADKLGLTLDYLEKSRLFAREFSKPELNRLCREIEAGGFPIGGQHLVRLMRLPANRRWTFLDRTIQHRWSCRRLASAILEQTGRRRTGRTPMVRDREEARQKFLVLCEQWKRLYAVIREDKTGDGTIVVVLPPSVDRLIRRCDRAIQKLDKALRRFRKF
jgi:hypothetical protein